MFAQPNPAHPDCWDPVFIDDLIRLSDRRVTSEARSQFDCHGIFGLGQHGHDSIEIKGVMPAFVLVGVVDSIPKCAEFHEREWECRGHEYITGMPDIIRARSGNWNPQRFMFNAKCIISCPCVQP